jgi:hypothetical protein
MDKDKKKSELSQNELWRLEEIEQYEFDYRLDRDEYIRESEGE